MPQSVHQSSGERGSSNEDQVKKQAALDGAHMESFDRLCEVINKTADVTNRKSGEAVFQTPIREWKTQVEAQELWRHIRDFYTVSQKGPNFETV